MWQLCRDAVNRITAQSWLDTGGLQPSRPLQGACVVVGQYLGYLMVVLQVQSAGYPLIEFIAGPLCRALQDAGLPTEIGIQIFTLDVAFPPCLCTIAFALEGGASGCGVAVAFKWVFLESISIRPDHLTTPRLTAQDSASHEYQPQYALYGGAEYSLPCRSVQCILRHNPLNQTQKRVSSTLLDFLSEKIACEIGS